MGILVAILGVWFSSSLVKGHSKAVTTSLTTKWSSTPLLLETSEFLSEEGQEKFWNFVEASQNIKTPEHDGTDYTSYHGMLKVACQSLSPLQQNLLKFSLSLRSYSATVQAFQQIAADEPPPKGCTLFFAVHGEKTCEFESLGKLLQTASERRKNAVKVLGQIGNNLLKDINNSQKYVKSSECRENRKIWAAF